MIKIREVVEFLLPTGGGESQRFFMIRYRTDDGRAGVVRVPKEEFTEEKAIEAIQAELAKEIDPFVGKEIEVE